MTRESHRISFVSAVSVWLWLACAPSLAAGEPWTELEHPSLDALFVNSLQPVPSYASATLGNVSVWFPEGDRGASTLAEELRALTRDRFEAAIEARGMAPAGNRSRPPAGDTVVVRVQLIDLRALPGDGYVPQWAKAFRFRVAAGRVTLVAELIDEKTGRTVLRMADLQDTTFVDTPAAVDRMLQQWGAIVARNARSLPGPRQLAATR